MKIRLLMENAFVAGGTSRTVSTTASALAERGHDVELVSLFRRREHPTFPPSDRRVKLRVLVDEYSMRRGGPIARARGKVYERVTAEKPSTIGHKSDYRSLKWNAWSDRMLLRWLAAQKDGVIVGTRPNVNLVLAKFAPEGPVLVAQDHVNFATYRPGIQKAIPKRYHRFDAIVTLTEGNARDYAEVLGEGAGPRILTIPNGMPDVGHHRATLDEKIVVSLGRLSEQKGYDRLLPVWAKVVAQRPDWKLRIYGGGDWRETLENQLASLGLQDSAKLMGRTPEPFARMAEASLFVMTSRREGMPMVLLEAMGVGLPVVSYDCPTGPRELIDDGVDGYVVPDGDEDALAARMIELMDDRDKRVRLSEAARRKASGYDVRALAVRWETLFQELAAAKADGSR